MSPEYAMEGNFSEKSNVYGVGVTMLEIVSGQKNNGIDHSKRALNLEGYVRILAFRFFPFAFWLILIK